MAASSARCCVGAGASRGCEGDHAASAGMKTSGAGGFDGVVLITRITLLGYRHDRRIDHLPAARDVALGFQVLVEALEQFLDQAG